MPEFDEIRTSEQEAQLDAPVPAEAAAPGAAESTDAAAVPPTGASAETDVAESGVTAAADLPAWPPGAGLPAADHPEPVDPPEPVAPEPQAARPVVAGPAVQPAAAEPVAVEDPREELRKKLGRQPGDWYVVHSYAGYENKVKANLETRINSLDMEDYIFQIEEIGRAHV